MQTEIDFSFRHENNRHSQGILEDNADRFYGQCKQLFKILNAGARITVREAILRHGIGDLRRRIKDLRDAGVPIKDEVFDGRYKAYYLDHK